MNIDKDVSENGMYLDDDNKFMDVTSPMRVDARGVHRTKHVWVYVSAQKGY